MKSFKAVVFAILFSQISLSQTVTPVLINGAFNIFKEKIIYSDQVQIRNSASAYFTYTASTVLLPNNLTFAGHVKLNNKKLKYNNNVKFYGSHLKNNNGDADNEEDECNNTTQIESIQWRVTGAGSIPSLNFIYGAPFPEFSTALSLPSSVVKSDTLILTLNNVSNADSIYVNIWDDYFNEANRKYLKFVYSYTSIQSINGIKSIKISPIALGQLSVGTSAYISIEAVKKNYQIVAGKNFLFYTSSSIVKPLISIIN